MAWADGLSGSHLEIAGSEHSRIGVLAGPGTGKTSYGLMRRVVRLLESGLPGERILLLSFTRVAAADLRDKVAALDAPGVDCVRATTLHGYCFGLLQRDSVLAVTGRTPRILLDHESDLMLRDIGGNFGNIHARRRLLEAFVAGWARGENDHPGLPADPDDRSFEHGVMTWLHEHRAMLIGEVVPEAHRYLTTNPAADELNAFDHVIADEYQDLNTLEQELLLLLATNASLCVAGDDDQSIYSVRYANPSGILSFLGRGDVEPHSIQVCGRCPEVILALANSLIEQAPGRAKDRLTSREAAAAGTVAIVQWPDVESEVEGIVAAIAHVVHAGREPGHILVLTNWRRIGERIRTRLQELEIPARSFFTEEELNSDESREAIALLRLVVNDRDAVALRVILGLGEGEGRSDAYQRLLTYCRANRVEPREALAQMADGLNLGLTVPALVQRFSKAWARIEQLRPLPLADLVDSLLPESQLSTTDLRATALEAAVESATAADLLKRLVESITQDDVPQNPNFVRIMSLHKSKGLTSPVVYIVGAVHGILPTLRDDGPAASAAATEEGRRLFYVAVTRASEELVISCASSMALADANARGVVYDRKTIRRAAGNGYVIRTLASPYIAELGPSAPRPVRGQTWLSDRLV